MPRDSRTSPRRSTRLVFFVVAGWVLLALTRALRSTAETAERAAVDPARRRRAPRRRLATTFATAVLFFAGASLTAIAGDRVAGVLEPDAEENAAAVVEAGAEALAEGEAAASDEATAEETAEAGEADALRLGSAADEAPAGPADGQQASPEAAPEATAEAAPEAASEAAPAPEAEHAAAEEPQPATAATSKRRVAAAPVVEESTAPVLAVHGSRVRPSHEDEHEHDVAAEPLDPEAFTPGTAATVWLHRVLPDPTPPSRRLAPAFAKELLRVARRERVHWSLVLGALRAERQGPTARRMFAASGASLRQTASGLAAVGGRKRDRAWAAVLSLQGDTALADRAVVLADYYRAVGLKSLVKGLRSQEKQLAKRLLQDERVSIYDGGRSDVAAGRVDVRTMATIAFMAESFGQVTVTSLISGHRLYSRPGVISAHVYGAAVDIAALDDQVVTPLTQTPGGLVEQAVRKLLLLPAEMRPRQVITLLGLGGPSFPLADHGDHIHVGY